MARAPTKRTLMARMAQHYRDTFETDSGRHVLADLMTFCNAYNPIEARDPSGRIDPYLMAMREGERNMAMRIAQMLAYRPDQFPELSTDNMDLLNSFASHHGPAN